MLCSTDWANQEGRSSRDEESVRLRQPGPELDHAYHPKRKKKREVLRYASRLHVVVAGLVLVGLALVLSLSSVRRHDGEAFLWSGRTAHDSLNIVPIPRIKKGTLSKRDFFETYGDMPVIVEGALDDQPFIKMNMDFQSLSDMCGQFIFKTVVYDKSAVRWGGHSEAAMMFIKDYIEHYIENNSTGELRYAHSGSNGMPNKCPLLHNYMLASSLVSNPLPLNGRFFNIAQPQMFLGPANSKTELHRDNTLMPFWFNLYLGAKAFRIIRFEDSNAYFPSEFESGRYTKYVFDELQNEYTEQSIEIWEPDLAVFPELSKVPIYEGTLYAGDLLYAPAGALHGAVNLESSFGNSENEVYPPALSHYIDVCFASGFAENCLENLNRTYEECPLEDETTAEAYNSCAQMSNIQMDGMKNYEDNALYEADVPLYRYSHTQSYESWCYTGCELYKIEYDRIIAASGEVPDGYLSYLNHQHDTCRSQCILPQ